MNQRGITLIEVLLTMTIFVIVTIVIVSFIKQGYDSYNFGDEQNEAIHQARRGVETMVQELRETLSGDDGSYPLQLADDQELIFFSDIDCDLVTERVHYFLEGTDFKRGVTEPSAYPYTYPGNDDEIAILSKYVQNNELPIFIYYNGDYPADEENNPLDTPADVTEVKLIRIHLKINVSPEKAPVDYDLKSNVQLRNLKDNL